MTATTGDFTLSGVAIPVDTGSMLDEICEHFVEHAEVRREAEAVHLQSVYGHADIRAVGGRLLIDLACPSRPTLEAVRNVIAEHLFLFAGDDPLDLSWSDGAPAARLPDLHEVTVVSTAEITPRMRRVTVACADVTAFIGGALHVRLLIPPKDREPVWPTPRADGRIGWPKGEDELTVRVYTIRAVDPARKKLHIDFVQHAADGHPAPGADFGRLARPGDRLALIGPGGGGVPEAEHLFLAGDETALPAIARIAAEAPATTRIRALIEVENAAERQDLPSAASLDVRWLHRQDTQPEARSLLADAVLGELPALDAAGHVWIGCERDDARRIREALKTRGHDRHRMSVAAYWVRE
ncbi:siderophore-interacting protein [Pseudomonas sp. R2.Fl]|nr:siderophore-interacting protein [Pseudomonas sp. R2.Fl]